MFESLTFKNFIYLTKHGSIRSNNKTMPGEWIGKTGFELGVINGFTLADICYFYFKRHNNLTKAYGELKRDLNMKTNITVANREDYFILKYGDKLFEKTENLCRLTRTSGICRLCSKSLGVVLIHDYEYGYFIDQNYSFEDYILEGFFIPKLSQSEIRLLKSCICLECRKKVKLNEDGLTKKEQNHLDNKSFIETIENSTPTIKISSHEGTTNKQKRARKYKRLANKKYGRPKKVDYF